jgi:xylulokinase
MLYIGVDLGTSAVKLLLMDGGGKILKIVSREYPISFPQPGWSEQNPEDWLRQTAEGIRELTRDCDRTQIAGIGAGGQMHGLVVLGGDDRVLRPAILWNDGRTAEETEYLNTVVGKEQLSRYTANIAFAGFTAPKLLWMRRHEPERFARIDKIMLPKDYLNYRLTGVHCTDVSDASGTLLMDVRNKRWSREMLDLCGIRESQLPRIFESFAPVGTLTPEAAAALGLPKGVRVCAGAGDNAAAAVGTATVGDGRCNLSLGTSGTIFISSNHFGVDPNNALHAFAHADGHYHLMGCMLSAASCNKWWMDNVLGTADYAAEQRAVSDDRLGRNHVFFLPYLMGERSPHNDPAARGGFLGLTMDSSRADMTQAVLEGVAFGMRDSLEVARSLGLDIRRSKLCGGGAKSPLWRKIFANVLDLDLETVETEEGPGYGAAILAAVACGEYGSVREAADRLVRITGTVRPNPEIAERYGEQYRKFRKIYPALKTLFPQLGEGGTRR